MRLNKNHRKHIINLCTLIFGLFIFNSIFAASNDLLQGTTQSATGTFFASGKIYIYLAEIVGGLVGYIMTRKLTVFIGIIVVAFIITDIAPHFLNQS